MATKSNASFAFLVLAYNHQDFILDHLESIKYLVETHGKKIKVDLIINDDHSTDKTRFLIDSWLAINSNLFHFIKTIYNPANIGTCASINNMLNYMTADQCKLTAGDDVYSCENIFEFAKFGLEYGFVSGRALFLLGDQLFVNRVSNLLATATQVIYEKDSVLHRFKHLSYTNAPNILYAKECLMHPKVRSFLQQFDVVEDWPIQIAIAREFQSYRFKLVDRVFVYYRRTTGSTYIVASQRFVNDKLHLYSDLIKNEVLFFERIRLTSRKLCFKMQNRFFNIFFNLDFYLFVLSFLFSISSILKKEINHNLSIESHGEHLRLIKNNVEKFKILIGDLPSW
ncbi:MAG: glycosyltransferase family 2 protein [Peptococcaceae bacterium]|jgi:glycosyltransferase involved in cell wall biosynthesis|nr:glycosyltransferase family 2 protein [Peptococcaceae bacterium]